MHSRIIIVLFAILAYSLSPVTAQEDNTTENLQMWLITNENRLLTQLSRDRKIIDLLNSPITFLPLISAANNGTENEMLKMHYSIQNFLRESDNIFTLTSRFQNDYLEKTLSKTLFGKWALSGLIGYPQVLIINISPVLDSVFQASFLLSLGIDKERDSNIVERFESSYSKLSDTEKRTLKYYIENFLALYPTNISIKSFSETLETGINKRFGKLIQSLISAKPSSSTVDVLAGLDDFGNIDVETENPVIREEKKTDEKVKDPSPEKSTEKPADATAEASVGKIAESSPEKIQAEIPEITPERNPEKISEKTAEKKLDKKTENTHEKSSDKKISDKSTSDKTTSEMDNSFDGFINDI
ncbi:MAG: hypothetical protein HQM10_03235 [Candidatus Riflebacteria bacterium]|nr:hypothetical protein [Candidatus Riflebacteria bacterium]